MKNPGTLGRNSLISAGILIGAGMGGFFDGITFHQLLQWHNMLSAKLPPNNLINAKINMFWDGLFHAAVWIMTLAGLTLLWNSGKRKDIHWSGKTFWGSALVGWGLFNFIEGVINHLILNIHHVFEYTGNKLPYDMAFLLSGVIFTALGWNLIKRARTDLLEKEKRN